MITVDKIRSKHNKFFRTLFFHLIFWFFSLLFYTFITGEQQIFITYLDLLLLDNIYLVLSFLSFCIALWFTLIDVIFSDRIMRFFPIQITLFVRSVLYFASVFMLILIAARSPLTIYTKENYKEIFKLLPGMDITFYRFLLFFYIFGFFNHLIRGTIKKVGRGNMRSWVLGFMNKPREAERIFMFLDMKASTIMAEQLGHKKFSHLVQDLFNDMAIVDNYHGEIYQYLGDGAIISWSLKRGLKKNNFLRAYFAFTRLIHKRRRYYNRKYGIIPKFKAGVHAGKVMVLQVGQIRRDISYNGDTINTAARIESMCNEYRQHLLISGELLNLLSDQKKFTFKMVGNIKLKGKRKAIDIYQVRKKK
ncbi:MAG: adenylate/guanylate cyclase domain-containing protein [Bacteroidales bacterium]|jgi:adenylate cyclase|nr:adenylate/guanylate cyclase domain-containing protein [Bacteroidales bacterium]